MNQDVLSTSSTGISSAVVSWTSTLLYVCTLSVALLRSHSVPTEHRSQILYHPFHQGIRGERTMVGGEAHGQSITLRDMLC
jgi:hypothetical protein